MYHYFCNCSINECIILSYNLIIGNIYKKYFKFKVVSLILIIFNNKIIEMMAPTKNPPNMNK